MALRNGKATPDSRAIDETHAASLREVAERMGIPCFATVANIEVTALRKLRWPPGHKAIARAKLRSRGN